MKFYKSIRWQLQIWYAFILLFAMSGSGLVAFYLHSSNAVQIFDQASERTLSRIQNKAKPPRPGGEPMGGRRGEPTDRHRPPRSGPPREMRQDPPMELSEADFDEATSNGYTYALWDSQGTLVHSSGADAAQLTKPPESNSAVAVVDMEALRGCYHTSPNGDIILVARSFETVRAEIRSFGWLLAASGFVIWAFGLTGGWWLSKRVVAPINRISKTAKSIADGRLSERIPADQAESELSELTDVLNHSFDTIEAHVQEQTQFTADASHELRTPITSLLTNTQTTLLRDRSPEDYKETVEICQRAGQRMNRLIDSLLALARVDSDRFQNTQRDVDLKKLLESCTTTLSKQAADKSQNLTVNAQALTCDCDPDQILQVLTNLIDNAIAYTQANGSIEVSLSKDASDLVITVTDNGPGINAKDLPNIFKRFYRADKSRTGSGAHTGLGLAISESIIRSHHGTISVESKVNQGTQFTIRLPLKS
ncbi:MAG: sensor histidine kinase [Opitutaceae bacterium]